MHAPTYCPRIPNPLCGIHMSIFSITSRTWWLGNESLIAFIKLSYFWACLKRVRTSYLHGLRYIVFTIRLYAFCSRYILSLALADLLVILICVPLASIVYTFESWPWGDTLCRITEYAKDVSIGVSVFTLTALSAERYCAIVNPLRKLQVCMRLHYISLWVMACYIPECTDSNCFLYCRRGLLLFSPQPWYGCWPYCVQPQPPLFRIRFQWYWTM